MHGYPAAAVVATAQFDTLIFQDCCRTHHVLLKIESFLFPIIKMLTIFFTGGKPTPIAMTAPVVTQADTKAGGDHETMAFILPAEFTMVRRHRLLLMFAWSIFLVVFVFLLFFPIGACCSSMYTCLVGVSTYFKCSGHCQTACTNCRIAYLVHRGWVGWVGGRACLLMILPQEVPSVRRVLCVTLITSNFYTYA